MSSKSSMIVIKQGSLHQDKASKNGVTKNMHMVVKNTPFCITVGSSDGKFDFSAAKMEASLLYDSEDRKPVPFLQKLPLEYFTHLNASGDQVTIEFRIKVLTSQYEGSLFLLKIDATNDKGSISTISESIKVVSKPEQIRRLKQNSEQPSKSESGLAPAKKRKRVSDEDSTDASSSTDIMEMLQAIRETQLRQMELLQQSQMNDDQVCFSSEDFSPLNLSSVIEVEPVKPSLAAPLSLEQAFHQLIAAYSATDAAERPLKIRRLVETDSDVASSLAAIATDLSSALPAPLVKSEQGESTSQCQCEGCPFKKNMEQIDSFYSEFFNNPFESVEFAQ